MGRTTVVMDVPEELIEVLGSPEGVAVRAREALILSLLGEGVLSQGRAAHILGITRWDLLDLMALHQVPSGPQTAEEVVEEVERIDHWLANAGDQ